MSDSLIHAPLSPFQAPSRGVTPSTEGAEAMAQAARVSERYQNQKDQLSSQSAHELGIAAQGIAHAGAEWEQQAQLHAENQEVSMYGVAAINRAASAEDEWATTVKNTDPNLLPQARQQFLDRLAQQNDSFASSAQTDRGREFAEKKANDLTVELWHKTAADVSTGAGIALTENFKTMANSGGVAAARDFSSVDGTLKTFDDFAAHSVDENPNLTPAQTVVMHDQINSAKGHVVGNGLQALIQNNPTFAKQILDSGRYDDVLGGDAINEFSAKATNAIKAQQAQQRGSVLGALNDNIASIRNEGKLAVAMPGEAQLQALTPDERAKVSTAM